mgnify:CR=1 FL=1
MSSPSTPAQYDAGENYPGTTYAEPASINRVTILTVGGQAFDADATYTIVTNDFLAAAATPIMPSAPPKADTTPVSPWTRW